MTTQAIERPVYHPRHLPTGMPERLRWLAAVGHEKDEAVVRDALATLQDRHADDARRNAAVATLWRALKPLIESTAIKVGRACGREVEAQTLTELDALIVNMLLASRSTSRAQFIVYAQRSLAHAVGHAIRSCTRALDVTQQHLDAVAGYAPSPEAEEIERVLMETIKAVTPTAEHITILEHFFGLNAFQGKANPNQGELAAIYGLSRQRIGQLIERVRDRLRAAVADDDGDGAHPARR